VVDSDVTRTILGVGVNEYFIISQVYNELIQTNIYIYSNIFNFPKHLTQYLKKFMKKYITYITPLP